MYVNCSFSSFSRWLLSHLCYGIWSKYCCLLWFIRNKCNLLICQCLLWKVSFNCFIIFCFVRLSTLLREHSFGFKLTYSVMILCMLREKENNNILLHDKQIRTSDFHYVMPFSQSKYSCNCGFDYINHLSRNKKSGEKSGHCQNSQHTQGLLKEGVILTSSPICKVLWGIYIFSTTHDKQTSLLATEAYIPHL